MLSVLILAMRHFVTWKTTYITSRGREGPALGSANDRACGEHFEAI